MTVKTLKNLNIYKENGVFVIEAWVSYTDNIVLEQVYYNKIGFTDHILAISTLWK